MLVQDTFLIKTQLIVIMKLVKTGLDNSTLAVFGFILNRKSVWVAQFVEQLTENQCVNSSNLFPDKKQL